ncbi:MAG TPA: GNAT family N-acetyltransferase [Nitrospiraceae bacterium]|nr:GNAT family N-acetyltransferase [Nitrospiraceae bacterium]
MAHRTAGKLTFHEVDAARWDDFVRLFQAKGSPHYCWCMAWRATPDEVTLDGPGRKLAMQKRVRAGTPVGLLGYQGQEPVAWCSIAPRTTFRGLVSTDSSDNGIWSITCFFVLRRLRRAGIAKKLLGAALRHAREHGAKLVEAYPVEADSPSYRHMGFVSMFEKAGFRQVGRQGTRRHVMQRKLRARAK